MLCICMRHPHAIFEGPKVFFISITILKFLEFQYIFHRYDRVFSQSVSQCTEAAVVVIIVSLVDAFHNSNISNEIKFLGPYVP